MKGGLVGIILVTAIVILTGCDQVSQSDAEKIAEKFIVDQVRPIVRENGEMSQVEKAELFILESSVVEDQWKVLIKIRSNQTGEIKQRNVLVGVDRNSGEVVGIQPIVS